MLQIIASIASNDWEDKWLELVMFNLKEGVQKNNSFIIIRLHEITLPSLKQHNSGLI